MIRKLNAIRAFLLNISFQILHTEEKNITVEWYHDEDDEEMMETGEDYEDVTGLPFEIISMEEE